MEAFLRKFRLESIGRWLSENVSKYIFLPKIVTLHGVLVGEFGAEIGTEGSMSFWLPDQPNQSQQGGQDEVNEVQAKSSHYDRRCGPADSSHDEEGN